MQFVRSVSVGANFAARQSAKLIPAALVLFQCAFGATYYVSPSGSDSNPGTASQPYRTVARGVQQAVAGDTVILGDGTYGNEGHISDGTGGWNGYAAPVQISKAGTSSAWITLKAQNKGKAILDCGTTSTALGCDKYIVLYSGAAYWVFQDLVFTRGAWGGLGTDNSASHIRVKGCTFANIGNWNDTTQIGEDGIGFDSGATDWWIEGNVFHDIGRPGGSSLDHGIYAEGTNVTVINNVFYNNTHGWSIQLANGANGWLIANNTFAFPNPTQNGQIMLWNTNSNITIRNNIFYNPQGTAITRYTSTLSNCVIDHNLVYGASSVISSTSGCTMGTNQIGANPNFVNASSVPYDFHVQSGGAGIDTGVTISSVSVDYDQITRPQGTAYDLGAYEYSSGGTVSSASVGPVISGVFTSSTTSSSAVINWTTDVASSSAVQYGVSGYTSTTPTNSTLVTIHSVTLSGLQAGTLYHFRAVSGNSGGTTYSTDYTFTTSPAIVTASFSLSPSPATVSVNQGSSASSTISATLVSGSPGTVSFSANSLPSGVNASFSSASCNPTCSTVLTFTAASTATAGTYAIQVNAAGSSASGSATVTLTVNGTSTATADTTTGMMADWDFNELSGSTTADLTGHGNTATLWKVAWNSTVCGGCGYFNGTNAYASIAESSSLEPTTMTVSMWVRPGTGGGSDPRLIAKRYSWDVKLNGSNRYPQFSANGKYAQTNFSLPAGGWSHVVFTFSSGTVTAYVNGKPVGFVANTFTSSDIIPLQMYGIYLGADSSRSTYYNGYLDDIRIYNRVLSATDVASLYSNTLHTK